MDAIAGFVTWVIDSVGRMGYPGIFVLMFLASSFLPVPSQAALIPAGYLAFQGRLSLPLVILVASLGTVSGALANYFLAAWLGRPFLLRYGRWLFLTEARLAKAEAFFLKHGEISTFLGRLVSGVRHFISLPAGLARMHLGRFIAFTALGGCLYDGLQVGIGYLAGGNQDLIEEYSWQVVVGLVTFGALLLTLYVIRAVRAARAARK